MKKPLNINKINKLCKNQRIFTYNLLLNGLKWGSNSTYTSSRSTITRSIVGNPGLNLPLQNDGYPICPDCNRSLPNKSYLKNNRCIWCLT